MHKENNTNNTTKLYTETWKPSISILQYSEWSILWSVGVNIDTFKFHMIT